MNSETKEGKKRKSIIIVIFALLVTLIAAGIGVTIYNMPANRLSRQLDLGEKYLEEQNYEQAVVEFDKAIAIDPMNERAYIGKAEAYVGMGDYKQALSILKEGYGLLGSEKIYDKMQEIITQEKELQLKEEAKVEEIRKLVEENDEIGKITEEKSNEEIERLVQEEEVQKEDSDGTDDKNDNDTGDSEEYDASGNLVKKSYWVDDWETYFHDEFDANGNLKKRSYWNEWQQVFIEEIYNEKGLLITVNQYEKDGSGAGSYEYEYDENGNCVREITNSVY